MDTPKTGVCPCQARFDRVLHESMSLTHRTQSNRVLDTARTRKRRGFNGSWVY